MLDEVDGVQRAFVFGDQAITQCVELVREVIVAAEDICGVRGQFICLDEALVIRLGFSEPVLVAFLVLWLLGNTFFKQTEVLLLGGFEGIWIGFVAEQDDQLVAQGLP
ncbi:hypothetical protein D3C81_1553720 [compost metagenome]